MAFDVKKTLKISLAFAWISVLANIMDTAVPLVLTNQFDFSYTDKGIVMALDNIVGLFILPICGWLSDKTRSRFGKRTPYIVIASALAILFWFAAGVALVADNAKFFIIMLAAALTSIAVARPASLSLLPDVTCMKERRRANAVTQIVSVVFTLIGVVICSIGGANYYVAFFVSGAIMAGLLVAFIFTVNEPKFLNEFRQAFPDEADGELTEEQQRALELGGTLTGAVSCSIAKLSGSTVGNEQGAEVYVKKHRISLNTRAKVFLLTCVFFFYMGFNGLSSSLSNYATEVLHLTPQTFVLPQLFCMVAACIMAVPASTLSKKLGRKNSLILGMTLMLIAFMLASQESGLSFEMMVAFVLAGIGYSIALVNFYPYFLELNSNKSVGKSTGLFNNAMMIAMIITPILTGVLSDNIFIGVLFPYCSVALALSLGALFLVPPHTHY